MTRSPRLHAFPAALIALGLLVAPLAGCAPEPENGLAPPTSSDEKQEPEGGSWPEENPEEVFEKKTELPADFPAEFLVPDGAEIIDTGSRSAGVWYLVLTAPDAEAALETWGEIIASGGFTPSDEMETSEGGIAATLTSAALQVTAMTIPQDDGSVQISYDIVQGAL